MKIVLDFILEYDKVLGKQEEKAMIGEIALSILGIILWLFGITLLMCIARDKYSDDKITSFLGVLVLFGVIGLVFNLPALTSPLRNSFTEYEVPVSIIRTNNITLVTHMTKEGVVVNETFSEVSWWNATNIRVRVTWGENLLGWKVNPTREIIIDGEE